MYTEKRELLKLFQEWGEVKENDEGGEFKCDTFYVV
jgi:hypothetical protein